MTVPTTDAEFPELLALARDGDGDAVGVLLERCRPWLRAVARDYLGAKLSPRMDASDVIQQTCLSACASIGQFQGTTEAEFIAWLKRIHECNLQNIIRDNVTRQRRSVSREASLTGSQYDGLANVLPELQSTPSQHLLASERAALLIRSLETLPDDQLEAVRLRYIEGLPVADIADQMERTLHSVAGLIKRGVAQLRKQLETELRGDR